MKSAEMRRLLVLITSVCILLALCGCGASSKGQQDSTGAADSGSSHIQPEEGSDGNKPAGETQNTTVESGSPAQNPAETKKDEVILNNDIIYKDEEIELPMVDLTEDSDTAEREIDLQEPLSEETEPDNSLPEADHSDRDDHPPVPERSDEAEKTVREGIELPAIPID